MDYKCKCQNIDHIMLFNTLRHVAFLWETDHYATCFSRRIQGQNMFAIFKNQHDAEGYSHTKCIATTIIINKMIPRYSLPNYYITSRRARLIHLKKGEK